MSPRADVAWRARSQFAAMRRGAAARAWALRIDDLPALHARTPAWEAESLVKFTLATHRLKPRFVDFFFFRLRPDGVCAYAASIRRLFVVVRC